MSRERETIRGNDGRGIATFALVLGTFLAAWAMFGDDGSRTEAFVYTEAPIHQTLAAAQLLALTPQITPYRTPTMIPTTVVYVVTATPTPTSEYEWCEHADPWAPCQHPGINPSATPSVWPCSIRVKTPTNRTFICENDVDMSTSARGETD